MVRETLDKRSVVFTILNMTLVMLLSSDTLFYLSRSFGLKMFLARPDHCIKLSGNIFLSDHLSLKSIF